MVGKNYRIAQAAQAERGVNQAGDFFFLQRLVDVFKRQAFGQDFGQQGAANCGFVAFGNRLELVLVVFHPFLQTNGDFGAQFHLLGVVSTVHFFHVGEQAAFAFAVDFIAGHVVETQYDILRRHNNRLAVGGREHVVGGQHQGTGFHLCFQAQRHVYGHLVTVEVGVERGAHQGVQLNGFAFNQNRLKSLNTQAVQGRGAVEHNRMFADHFIQNIPHHRHFLLHQLFRRFHGSRFAAHFQLVEDERFEQFQGHAFGQAALVQAQVGAYGNHGTAGVVDALTQQVLTEAAAFTFNHIGQRFERAFVGAGHGFAATAVIQQAVYRFLQHAFFVAHDDVGRMQLQQAFETVVAVDHATIKVVQIRSGKTTAVQRHQRTQIGRQHGQHVHNHPFQLHAAALEGFQHFQAFGQLFDFGFGAGAFQFLAQDFDFGRHVQRTQELTNAFGTHFGIEVFAVFIQLGVVIFFSQQLAALQRGHAGVGYHKGFEIQHTLNIAQGHVQYHAEAGRQ